MSSPSASGIEGLLVVGSAPRCGKTALTAGLAGALREVGFEVGAIKPLNFEPKIALREAHDQHFFNKVTRPLQVIEPVSAPSAYDIRQGEWDRVIDICRKMVYPVIIESCGSVASPLNFRDVKKIDAIDFAKMLGIPMLVVTPKTGDLHGSLAPTFSYLWQRGAHTDGSVIGWVGVETRPINAPIEAPFWDQEAIALSHYYKMPYLGTLDYSPSISVETQQQGNLIRQTEAGVDLLPVQQALNLGIPFR